MNIYYTASIEYSLFQKEDKKDKYFEVWEFWR